MIWVTKSYMVLLFVWHIIQVLDIYNTHGNRVIIIFPTYGWGRLGVQNALLKVGLLPSFLGPSSTFSTTCMAFINDTFETDKIEKLKV